MGLFKMSLKVFAAIPIPNRISDELEHLMEGVSGALWHARENLHITLAFYGFQKDENITKIQNRLSTLDKPAFDLTLQGVGFYDDPNMRTLWAGLAASIGFAQLAKECVNIGRQLNIDMGERTYEPHLTLAYLTSKGLEKKNIRHFKQRHKLYRSEKFQVDSICLYSSHKSKKKPSNDYQILSKHSLSGR